MNNTTTIIIIIIFFVTKKKGGFHLGSLGDSGRALPAKSSEVADA